MRSKRARVKVAVPEDVEVVVAKVPIPEPGPYDDVEAAEAAERLRKVRIALKAIQADIEVRGINP